jgi:transcriptional regulator
MYVPQHFAETDNAVLHALIRAHPLGTWVTAGDDGLVANHIPFLIDPRAASGHADRARAARTDLAHVPRRRFHRSSCSRAQAYITPSWYPSKQAHGRQCRRGITSVHAHGMPRAIEDRAWLCKHLEALVSVHEARWRCRGRSPTHRPISSMACCA